MQDEEVIRALVEHLRLERGLAENSIRSYRSDLKKALLKLKSEDSGATLLHCDTPRLQSLLRSFYEDSMSPRSQARMVSALRVFFSYALEEGIITSDPAELLETPRIATELPDVLSIEETAAVIEAVDLSKRYGHRDRAILEVLYGCGLRVSELCGLLLSKLDREEHILRIQGKGNKERWVPIAGQALRQIELYIDQERCHQEVHSEFRDHVFLNHRGKALSRVSIFHLVKRNAERAGIKKKVSPHTFRHSFATHMVQAGADLRAVQEMLGHSSITTTEIYAHLDREYLREAILSFHPLS